MAKEDYYKTLGIDKSSSQDDIKKLWRCDSNIEITAEANPSSSEISKFIDFRSGGINRLSVGVQSFERKNLRFLGRNHTVEESEKAVIAASKVFNNYTFDLIYALPDQTCVEWEQELGLALKFARDHLAIYQLTIEPGTEFYKNRIKPANENLGSKLYQVTNKTMKQAGYDSYEISNYSKPKFECRHNLLYWNGLDYLGIGPGAHGRLTQNHITQSIQSYKNPNKWLNAALKEQNGEQDRLSLKPSERFEEI
jgi:putative oxygen-independent coproporphyrinogen III oxidase